MDMSTIWTIFKTLLVLMAVIFLANFLLKLLNQEIKKKNKLLKVLERIQLSSTSSLNLIEVCGAYFLISSSDKEVKVLMEVDKEEVEAAIEMKEYEGESKDIESFIDILKRGKES